MMQRARLHILIVEDETLLALNLATKIQKEGYDVIDYATTPQEAFDLVESHPHINLILMDIHLNDTIDGIALYHKLPTQAPVIYLTAYTDDKTVEAALDTHPLGYLVKPIDDKELLILLKLAQKNLEENPLIHHIQLNEEFHFDLRHDFLYSYDKKISLYGKKLNLLKILIDAKGNYVPLSVLEEILYQDAPPSPSSLRTLIYRLRSLLGSDLIETQRAQGVRLNLPKQLHTSLNPTLQEQREQENKEFW